MPHAIVISLGYARFETNAEQLSVLDARERSRTALVVCVVCGRPIEPHCEREWQTCESVQTHEGDCWQQYKRGAF